MDASSRLKQEAILLASFNIILPCILKRLANASSCSDLFRVLKGGGNNFGIITRFILRTVPSAPVWGGMALRPVDVIPAAAKAFVNFTAKSADDVDSSLMFVAAYAPRFGGGVALTICTNMVGKERPPALREALDMPEVMNNFKTTSLQEVITYTALPTHY